MRAHHLRPTVWVPAALFVLSSSAKAQACYDHDSQCFSFAPHPSALGNVETGLNLRSEKLSISGDFRLRLRASDTPDDKPYANPNDQQATRGRIGLDYVVNEGTRMFFEYNFSETWAGSEKYSDADPANPVNGISQAYLHAEDLLGFEDTWRVGRSNYVLGNGLILGSCDFLQYPSTFTGIWASRAFGEHAVELFVLDNYGQLNLQPGTRFVGATANIQLGDVDEGDIVSSLDPFFMAGTGDADIDSKDDWYGLSVDGRAAEIDWSIEYARRDVDGGDDVGAYRVSLTKEFEGMVDELRLVRTDSEGAMHVNPADFNSAGLLHQYGGAWRSDLQTTQLGVGLRPGRDFDLDFNLLAFDGDAATQGETELDVMLGKPLKPGVYGWIGYGRDDDDRQVGYLQLTVFF